MSKPTTPSEATESSAKHSASDNGRSLKKRLNACKSWLKNQQKQPRKRRSWVLGAAALFLGGLVVTVGMALTKPRDETQKPQPYSRFAADVEKSAIQEILVQPGFPGERVKVTPKEGKPYFVDMPRMGLDVAAQLATKGIEVKFEEPSPDVSKHLSTLVLLLMVGLMFMTMAPGMSSMPIFQRRKKPSTRFADVAGAEEAKRALQEIVDYLKDPTKFEQLGAKFPKGVVMFGDPGTGKTLLARAVAGEAGANFLSMSGSDFNSMFMGLAGMKIKRVFAQARRMAPCVLFIDELDAVGGKRLSEGTSSAREMGSTLNQMLVEMDGFEANSGVIVISATNRLEMLDPALLRSGRFDRRIHMPSPNIGEREQILRIHGAGLKLAVDFDYKALGQATIGMSGADLANVMNQAAMLAVRDGASAVTTGHAFRARDMILMGEERQSTAKALDERTREILAYHEAGHAVMGILAGPDPVTRVSIVPRGPALGLTFMSPKQDRFLYDRQYLDGQLLVLLGGRASESLVFQMATTGARDDLARASQIALEMVSSYGMSRLGMMTIDGGSSQEMRYRAEREASRILERKMREAMGMLKSHKSFLDAVATALLEREEIDEAMLRELAQKHGASAIEPLAADNEAVVPA